MGMGFEGVLQTLKRNREQKTIEEESVEQKQCPYDMWPLKENERGQKSCPICGRTWD